MTPRTIAEMFRECGNPLLKRIAKRVRESPSGCLEWMGYARLAHPGSTLRYGYMRVAGVWKRVHRIAFAAAKGPIPDGLTLDHLCRNPLCVNPDHLEPVTIAENTKRGGNRIKTHCQRGHAYAGNNLRVISGKRYCRICCAAATRAWKRRRRAAILKALEGG